MYARASNRTAHDRLWALIRDGLRAQGVEAPDALDHQIDCYDSWGHPDLALGQICNLPYRAEFRDRVTYIGTADYALKGCAPGQYRSLFITGKGGPDAPENGMRFAYNAGMSHSGWGSPQAWAEAHGVTLRPTLRTGSHAASLEAVASGAADLAALDAQCWRIETGDNPLTAEVKVIGATEPSPGMSFITRAGQDPAPYRAAIAAAIDNMDQPDRTRLNLRGLTVLPDAAFDLPLPPAPADIFG